MVFAAEWAMTGSSNALVPSVTSNESACVLLLPVCRSTLHCPRARALMYIQGIERSMSTGPSTLSA